MEKQFSFSSGPRAFGTKQSLEHGAVGTPAAESTATKSAFPRCFPKLRITQRSQWWSWNHRITECSGLEATAVGHLVQPPCRSRVTQSSCTGPCPGRSWISPEKETPQPPWAACSRALSPSEGRSSSSCSDGTSCASVCEVIFKLLQNIVLYSSESHRKVDGRWGMWERLPQLAQARAVRLAALGADPATSRCPSPVLPLFSSHLHPPHRGTVRLKHSPPPLFKHLKDVKCRKALCQSKVLESPGNMFDVVQMDVGLLLRVPRRWGWHTFGCAAWW